MTAAVTATTSALPAQQQQSGSIFSKIGGFFSKLNDRTTSLDETSLVAAAQQVVAQQQAQTGAAVVQTGQSPSQAAQGAATVGTQTTSTSTQTQTSATSAADTAIAVPSTSYAPRTRFDYWTKHMAQFRGKYLPDGPTMEPNCGPASVTMALRMIGLNVAGAASGNSQDVLTRARVLATGSTDASDGTTDSQLESLINKSGAQWAESKDNFGQVSEWVKQGIPVVLSGNPSKGWNHRYSNSDVQHFDGGHWVTVSAYDPSTGYYVVNDPLSQIGPINVSESELRSYTNAHGKLGIAVFR